MHGQPPWRGLWPAQTQPSMVAAHLSMYGLCRYQRASRERADVHLCRCCLMHTLHTYVRFFDYYVTLCSFCMKPMEIQHFYREGKRSIGKR